jgi:hypothetical protein
MQTHILASNGIRTHDTNVREDEDTSCLRPGCPCNRCSVFMVRNKRCLRSFIWANKIVRMGGLWAKICDAREPYCCSTGCLFTPALPSPLSLCPTHQCGPFFDPALRSPRYSSHRPQEDQLIYGNESPQSLLRPPFSSSVALLGKWARSCDVLTTTLSIEPIEIVAVINITVFGSDVLTVVTWGVTPRSLVVFYRKILLPSSELKSKSSKQWTYTRFGGTR